MLRCTMTMDSAFLMRLRLDDLLADLVHARRTNDLGRLALLAYCEVRRWARAAGEGDLARNAAQMVIDSPQPNREAFLAQVDELIDELERLRIGAPHWFGGSGNGTFSLKLPLAFAPLMSAVLIAYCSVA